LIATVQSTDTVIADGFADALLHALRKREPSGVTSYQPRAAGPPGRVDAEHVENSRAAFDGWSGSPLTGTAMMSAFGAMSCSSPPSAFHRGSPRRRSIPDDERLSGTA
jgi:hypothetical protein